MELCFLESTKISTQKLSLETMYYNFQKVKNSFQEIHYLKWSNACIIQFCLPNNIILLIIVDNFDPNLISININMLKPC